VPLNSDTNYSQSINTDLARGLLNIHDAGLDGGSQLSPFANLLSKGSSDSDFTGLSNPENSNYLSKYDDAEGRKMSPFLDLNFCGGGNSDVLSSNELKNDYVFVQPQESVVVAGWESGTASHPDYANNTFKAAREVVLGSQALVLNDFVGDEDQKDCYTFNVAQNTNFNLVLNGLGANADLELFNDRGRVIASSNNAGSTSESITYSNLDAGQYYVRVSQAVNGENTNYSLSFSTKLISDVSTNVSSAEIPQATSPEPVATSSSANSYIQQILDLTNSERTKGGLQPLRLNAKLNESAQAHSQDMAIADYFSHTGANGSNAGDRAASAGYHYSSLGENIAAGYITPEEVVQGWMNSPGHRANIMNGSYQELGVGYYYLADDTGNVNYNYYWTQEFGIAG
jgi:uncharacterized protein YkwD